MPVARTSTLNLNELIAETSRNQRPGELSINFGLDGAQSCGNLPQGLQYRLLRSAWDNPRNLF
jgi:hypothetical protein